MVEHWAGLAMPQRKKASKGGSLTLQVRAQLAACCWMHGPLSVFDSACGIRR